MTAAPLASRTLPPPVVDLLRLTARGIHLSTAVRILGQHPEQARLRLERAARACGVTGNAALAYVACEAGLLPEPNPRQPPKHLRLTERERDVLPHLAAGVTSEDIALRLNCPPAEVRHTRCGLCSAFMAANSTHFVTVARATGLPRTPYRQESAP
ncbi:LuxR C-terminal-related transcriptional regulator [Streptomyces uncialis]|uniref:helix-turn-helix transcriptional regulator n=1 Tax=Streptomyces uncialis TaxID=1048205 RepID=UPI002E333E42|nr:LuxR C-terminal-related transcriptional regulator [Streptomyces uncialis]